MKHRGRQSQGEIPVIPQRPEPLKRLTAEQKKTWKRVVNALPADWFRDETLDLLAEYCEQVALSHKISKMIDALSIEAPVVDLEKLVRLKEKSARMVVTIATKMRISQQSTYHSEKVKDGAPPAGDPWSSAR